MKNIRWGVIGSGGIARRRTIPEGIVSSEQAELVAVFDVNRTVNLEVAHEFKAYAASSIEDLLNQDIDAVYIASPVDKHFEHVSACAKAKKHILCEKALGLTVSEVEIMMGICQQEGVLFGTAFMMRFHSHHKEALKFIQEGKLGKPVYARAQLSCWYPPIVGAWRQYPEMGGGGSLMDMGSHCIDLLEMFFGKVKQVSCFINNTVHTYKSEDSAVVSMFFENGALATVDTFFCIPDDSSKNILELYGSAGSILAKGTLGQGSGGEMVAYLAEKSETYDANQLRNSSGGISIDPVQVNTYKAEIDEFSRAILEKRLPENSAQIGLQNQKIIAACYEAARTQMVINIKNDI